jgi:hypothetical protein
VVVPRDMDVDSTTIWEALALGCIPVLRKGIGLDRTVYRLPVILLDSPANSLTSTLAAQAYVEALYRAEEFEYARITKAWYQRLIYKVSELSSASLLHRQHPIL